MNFMGGGVKKGELTTQQLVTIIILIASFVIILFLLYRLNLGQTSNSEICHNSVVLKAQSSVTSGALDCTTDYLCVSGGDKCTSISQTMQTSIDTSQPPSKIENQTFQAIADEMSNCWAEFGEGKIDYASASTLQQTSCSVCAITAFDDKVQKAMKGATYRDFYNYLRVTPKTSSQTYLQYLYGTNTLNGLGNLTKSGDYLNNVFDFSQQYFILTGIIQQGYLTGYGKNLYHLLPFTGNTKGAPYPVVILENTQQNYNAVGCSEFLTKS